MIGFSPLIDTYTLPDHLPNRQRKVICMPKLRKGNNANMITLLYPWYNTHKAERCTYIYTSFPTAAPASSSSEHIPASPAMAARIRAVSRTLLWLSTLAPLPSSRPARRWRASGEERPQTNIRAGVLAGSEAQALGSAPDDRSLLTTCSRG